MKITENIPPPSPPPPATYTLELTLEQLVRLGVLSFRYEPIEEVGTKTFYRSLPHSVMRRVEEAHLEVDLAVIDWSA